MAEKCHCNRCGRFHEGGEEDITSNFFHDVHLMFGYGSPLDMTLLDFSLCELCLFEIIKDFKHAPMVTEMLAPMEDDEGRISLDEKLCEDLRTKEDSCYEDLFIKNYKEIEDLPKK